MKFVVAPCAVLLYICVQKHHIDCQIVLLVSPQVSDFQLYLLLTEV